MGQCSEDLFAERHKYYAMVAGGIDSEEQLLELGDLELQAEVLQTKLQTAQNILMIKMMSVNRLLSQAHEVWLLSPGMVSFLRCVNTASLQADDSNDSHRKNA